MPALLENKVSLFNFLLGVVLGTCLTFLVFSSSINYGHLDSYMVINKINAGVQGSFGADSLNGVSLDVDKYVHKDDDEVATKLKEKVKVLIWVMTSPSNLKTKAKAIRDTWAKRCDQVIFISSESNPSFPAVGLNVSEGREHLTAKTMQAFQYLYEHYLNQADWFMKVDDDTFVIPENLRYFLSDKNSSEPIFFGHHFSWGVKQGYYSGGAGYVISKEALRLFGNNRTRLCHRDGGSEDKEFGRCMESLGVRTANSSDALGRTRFHCFSPHDHLAGNYPLWYLQRDTNRGITNVSDYAISFHYVSPDNMLALEFLVYHLRPYGVISGLQHLNKENYDLGV